jgi:GNAT superfamily N-acetyltransferase
MSLSPRRASAFPPVAQPPVLDAADGRRLGNLRMRLLTLDDLADVFDLREEVLAQLDHPDIYVREEDESAFVRLHLGGHAECRGETIGVFDGSRLVGYAMLGFPDTNSRDNLGNHIELGSRSGADVSHIASCMVRPEQRGHGLQRSLLAARFSLAQSQGRPLCIAMGSLHNHVGRRNLLREGMRITSVGTVAGLRRQLFAIDLVHPWEFDPNDVRLVPALDWEQQRDLTQQGWRGLSSVEGAGHDMLVFARHRGASAAAPV